MVSAAVLTADSADNETKMRLAEIYEVLNEPRKALDLVFQGPSKASPSLLPSLFYAIVLYSLFSSVFTT